MIPSKPGTMKIAMLEATRQTSLTDQQWIIFTSDQQLYKVALCIIWLDQDVFSNFVLRLGGMHGLMSFVRAIGTPIAGSGLEEILKSTFAGVPKMLTGKKFPQNVRALRIVLGEILRPVFAAQDILTIDELDKYLQSKATLSKTTKMWVECFIKPVFIIMHFVRADFVREMETGHFIYPLWKNASIFLCIRSYKLCTLWSDILAIDATPTSNTI